MAHPKGGQGNTFHTKHTFDQAYNHVGHNGKSFDSTTGKKITAKQSIAADNKTQTIVFKGETGKKSIHGNVCEKCWGYRSSCCKSWIGQCVEGLDGSF
ncbi:MAG: hypothetical protein BWX92_03306 [Deltaproteobacteria bacterium ADurb.Bin135]|nr:MAG: hypothetical protein BWX92_03306 [Deltaproteobacteria bacterium ADurb.Bin135]